jgi:hypothetical protein
LRRVRDLFPLTVGGLFVIAGALIATFYYGRERLDHILLAIGVIGLALVAVSLVFVMLAALIAWRSARKAPAGEPLMAECGHLTPTGFRLRNLWWMPFVDVTWTWIEPTAVVTTRRLRAHVHEDVCPADRDHFTSIVRRIEVRDVFGIARFAFRQRQARGGRFAPSVGGLEQMHVAHGLSGGDQISHQDGTASGDFYDMRSYGAGDPIRFILWKVFARTRELLVRTPELAIAPDRRTIAYLVAGEGDEPAAGAARVAVDSGALGTKWLLGADGCAEAVSSRDEAIDVLARSARASSEDSGALAEFLGRVAKGPATRAVVFVPARPGPWIERVAAAAASKPGQYPRVEFVVCTDGIGERQKRSAWARAVFSAPRAETQVALHEDLIAVVDALAKTGANVMVVDRPGGRLVHGKSLRGVAA